MSASSATVQNNVITDNERKGCHGANTGAIDITGIGGSPHILDNIIADNLDNEVAGISLYSFSTPTIKGNVIRNNGAGIEIRSHTGALVVQMAISPRPRFSSIRLAVITAWERVLRPSITVTAQFQRFLPKSWTARSVSSTATGTASPRSTWGPMKRTPWA